MFVELGYILRFDSMYGHIFRGKKNKWIEFASKHKNPWKNSVKRSHFERTFLKWMKYALDAYLSSCFNLYYRNFKKLKVIQRTGWRSHVWFCALASCLQVRKSGKVQIFQSWSGGHEKVKRFNKICEKIQKNLWCHKNKRSYYYSTNLLLE